VRKDAPTTGPIVLTDDPWLQDLLAGLLDDLPPGDPDGPRWPALVNVRAWVAGRLAPTGARHARARALLVVPTDPDTPDEPAWTPDAIDPDVDWVAVWPGMPPALLHAALERVRRRATPREVDLARHELANPLAALRGAVETLTRHRDALPADHVTDLLASAGRNVDRLQRLTERLLSGLPAPGADGVAESTPDRRRAVGIAAWLTDVAADAAAAAAARPEDVRVRADGRLEVETDVETLETIVRNLVENACKYGLPPVEVTARAIGDAIEVGVCDHGPGVPDSFLERMFEPYTRAPETADARPGTGLGLSLARAAAVRLGGVLLYDREDGSTRFRACIPARHTTGGSPPVVRPVAADIRTAWEDLHVEVHVELALAGRRASGRVSAPASAGGATSAAARATGDALETLLREHRVDLTVEVLAVDLRGPDGHRWITVAIGLGTAGGTEHLVGSAPLRDDLPGAACRATLAATNRRIGALIASPPGAHAVTSSLPATPQKGVRSQSRS
jgi:signal transduction histidine kinase